MCRLSLEFLFHWTLEPLQYPRRSDPSSSDTSMCLETQTATVRPEGKLRSEYSLTHGDHLYGINRVKRGISSWTGPVAVTISISPGASWNFRCLLAGLTTKRNVLCTAHDLLVCTCTHLLFAFFLTSLRRPSSNASKFKLKAFHVCLPPPSRDSPCHGIFQIVITAFCWSQVESFGARGGLGPTCQANFGTLEFSTETEATNGKMQTSANLGLVQHCIVSAPPATARKGEHTLKHLPASAGVVGGPIKVPSLAGICPWTGQSRFFFQLRALTTWLRAILVQGIPYCFCSGQPNYPFNIL